MARKKTDPKREDVIQEARDRYERAQEVWAPIYERCREDMRFSDPTDPQQWPEDAKRERKMAEGGARPCLTFDQTSQFVRQVVNTARRNRPAINYMPVDDQSDIKLADILKGLARQTEYASRADVAYITSLNHSTRGGIGFFRICIEDEKGSKIAGQKCARIRRVVDFETILLDPSFVEPDGSDAMWGFAEEMMSKAAFEKAYPGKSMVDWDDKGWFTKDHVRVCDYYRVVETEDGRTVEQFKISGEEVLDKTIFPAEFVPIFPVLGNEEWEEGKRKLSGCIRLARDAQITYNFERNAAYEAVALGPKAPWLAAAEAVEGYEAHWKQANRGNLAYLPWNALDENGQPVPQPTRISPAGIAVGWSDLAERSKNDIQSAMGQFEASAGNNPNTQSGRAVIALQDRADVGSFHYVDNLALSISHCGRVLTQIWPVIYDQRQIVRIIGEDEQPQFVEVNPEQPVAYVEQPTPDGRKVISVNPGVGRYDVRATVGPSFQTRQQETAAELGEMVNGNPQMLALLGDVLVKARNYPDADKIAKRFKAMLPPQVQAAEKDEQGPQELPPEVTQTLQQAAQEIEQLRAALQQAAQELQGKQMEAQAAAERDQLNAQVTLQKAQIEAESRERIAAMNNEGRFDETTLKAVADMILAKIQPPPALAAEVAQDLSD